MKRYIVGLAILCVLFVAGCQIGAEPGTVVVTATPAPTEAPAPTPTVQTVFMPGEGEPIPYVICQESADWTRPADDVQQKHLDDHPRFKGAQWSELKNNLKGIHVQVEQRSPQIFRDFLDLSGLWDASEEMADLPDCAFNLTGKVEVWFVLKKVISISSPESGLVVVEVAPTDAGYQSIHMNVADLGAPGDLIKVRYVDADGHEIAPPSILRRDEAEPDA